MTTKFPRRATSAQIMAWKTGRRTFLASTVAVGTAALLPASRVLAKTATGARIAIDTELGTIEIRLDLKRAPITAGHFLKLVESNALADGGSFYRSVAPDRDSNPVPINVIQGGLGGKAGTVAAIAHESTKTTGLTHQDGTISMARAAPGTASSEFFLCIGANPALDAGGKRAADGEGFAAFGQVIKGMDIVRNIHALPVSSEGAGTAVANQLLQNPVPITTTARR